MANKQSKDGFDRFELMSGNRNNGDWLSLELGKVLKKCKSWNCRRYIYAAIVEANVGGDLMFELRQSILEGNKGEYTNAVVRLRNCLRKFAAATGRIMLPNPEKTELFFSFWPTRQWVHIYRWQHKKSVESVQWKDLGTRLYNATNSIRHNKEGSGPVVRFMIAHNR